jgi:hypothetical protein
MIENNCEDVSEVGTQTLQILDEIAELAKSRIDAEQAGAAELRQRLSDLEERCKIVEAMLHKIIPELETLIKETEDATC